MAHLAFEAVRVARDPVPPPGELVLQRVLDASWVGPILVRGVSHCARRHADQNAGNKRDF